MSKPLKLSNVIHWRGLKVTVTQAGRWPYDTVCIHEKKETKSGDKKLLLEYAYDQGLVIDSYGRDETNHPIAVMRPPKPGEGCGKSVLLKTKGGKKL